MHFFEENLYLLEKVIHGRGFSRGKLSIHIVDQLRFIYSITEEAWYKNVKRFQLGNRVNYLLIGEAPPWTFLNENFYFYLQPLGPFFNSVFYAFECVKQSKDRAKAYNYLAERGFLLIDSLPYAFPFSSKQRNTEAYKELIAASIPWWQDKLNTCGLTCSSELKIALGFKMNGMALLAGLNNKSGNQSFELSEENIVADSMSNFPTSAEIKRVFSLTN